MHKLNWRILLFFAVALGLAGLCVLSVNHQVNEEMKLPPPRFEYNVAEGFRLWNPKAGVDSVSFESCRVEKRKLGFLSLGAFNILCIKGLVLNLPLEAEEESGAGDQGSGNRDQGLVSGAQGVGKEVLAGLLPKPLMERTGLYAKRFSGVKVDGFSVNRVVNRSLVPVFAAETMRNRGRQLELENCRVVAAHLQGRGGRADHAEDPCDHRRGLRRRWTNRTQGECPTQAEPRAEKPWVSFILHLSS